MDARPTDNGRAAFDALTAQLEDRASRRLQLEEVIDRGLATFVEVGEALLEIRDGRLFRDTHATFEAYCRERYPAMTYLHTRRLMDAAEVVASMPIGIAPRTEAVARELVPAMREGVVSLPDLMATATARSNGQPPTAAMVRSVVRESFRTMAAEAEAEMQAATAHYTDEQRAAVAPERMRQLGELRRLVRDLAALPDPATYASSFGRWLTPEFRGEAMAARGWLETLIGYLEASR